MRLLKVKASGITLDAIREIIERVSNERYNGNLELRDYSQSASGTLSGFTIRAKSSGYVSEHVWHPHDRYVVRHNHERATLGKAFNLAAHLREDHPYLAPGARLSASGRRSVAACWHAHRDVLAAIFATYPTMRISTGMADYDGREGFERNYPATADRNIGSMMQPVYMPELCDCAEESDADFAQHGITA